MAKVKPNKAKNKRETVLCVTLINKGKMTPLGYSTCRETPYGNPEITIKPDKIALFTKKEASDLSFRLNGHYNNRSERSGYLFTLCSINVIEQLKQAEILVSILNKIAEEHGWNIDEEGFGYDLFGNVTAGSDSTTDSLRDLWCEIGGSPFWKNR